MKIRMNDSREIGGHGLKIAGSVWDAPLDLAQQLIRQGVAEAVDQIQPKRAREAGKFKADDPSTEGENEAWEGGVSPRPASRSKLKGGE